MFTVTNSANVTSSLAGSPYAGDLDDLQPLPSGAVQLFTGIINEYVDMTNDNLSIITDTPSFIQSGTGNDIITNRSQTAGDVVIDPGGGTNTIHANPASRDTVIVDAEADAPLTDVIIGLTASDNVIIRGRTALSPNDFIDNPQGLMLTTRLLATGPEATIFLNGYNTADFAGGRLSITPFVPPSGMPDALPYMLLQVVR